MITLRKPHKSDNVVICLRAEQIKRSAEPPSCGALTQRLQWFVYVGTRFGIVLLGKLPKIGHFELGEVFARVGLHVVNSRGT